MHVVKFRYALLLQRKLTLFILMHNNIMLKNIHDFIGINIRNYPIVLNDIAFVQLFWIWNSTTFNHI